MAAKNIVRKLIAPPMSCPSLFLWHIKFINSARKLFLNGNWNLSLPPRSWVEFSPCWASAVRHANRTISRGHPSNANCQEHTHNLGAGQTHEHALPAGHVPQAVSNCLLMSTCDWPNNNLTSGYGSQPILILPLSSPVKLIAHLLLLFCENDS